MPDSTEYTDEGQPPEPYSAEAAARMQDRWADHLPPAPSRRAEDYYEMPDIPVGTENLPGFSYPHIEEKLVTGRRPEGKFYIPNRDTLRARRIAVAADALRRHEAGERPDSPRPGLVPWERLDHDIQRRWTEAAAAVYDAIYPDPAQQPWLTRDEKPSREYIREMKPGGIADEPQDVRIDAGGGFDHTGKLIGGSYADREDIEREIRVQTTPPEETPADD